MHSYFAVEVVAAAAAVLNEDFSGRNSGLAGMLASKVVVNLDISRTGS